MRQSRRLRRSFALLTASWCLFVHAAAAQQTAMDRWSLPKHAKARAATSSLEQESTTAEGPAADDWPRHELRHGSWELGAFVGQVFISDRNSFRTMTYAVGGERALRPVSTFKHPAVELGLRGGYYPLSYLGAEAEGMLALAETNGEENATLLAARAHVVLQISGWRIVPFVLAGVGYWNVRNSVSGNDVDPAFHFGGGLRINITRGLAFRLDVRDSITNNLGNEGYPHHIETLAAVSWFLQPAVAAASDSSVPTMQAALPGPPPPAPDSDGDGVDDSNDRCPAIAGAAPTGCPVRDADLDGVSDDIDECSDAPGAAPTGCPDTDQDGIVDVRDECATQPGIHPDGCPPDPEGHGILIAVGSIAGVEFDLDQAAIRSSSEGVLAHAASVLAHYPGLRVEIVGHTDNRGLRGHNMDLSRRRAESIKRSLIERGIDEGRLEAKGEGPDLPLTTNDTEAGRSKNRRIEFRIIR
jgi:OOP family OmpA-OmpF porin